MKLHQATALITGGASGLGAACARRFVAQGARVIVLDTNVQMGEALTGELSASMRFIQADVTQEDQVQAAIQTAAANFSEIQVLINCAGIAAGARTVSREGPHDLALFEKVLRVNLLGTFNVIRLVAEVMQHNTPNNQGERGVIINTASVAAYDGQIGQAAYAASKGGIASMTLPIARDLARSGIRVMAIVPGVMATPMVKNLPKETQESLEAQVPFPSRLGSSEEYAQLAQAIIENPYLNGEVIRLDGALRMPPR